MGYHRVNGILEKRGRVWRLLCLRIGSDTSWTRLLLLMKRRHALMLVLLWHCFSFLRKRNQKLLLFLSSLLMTVMTNIFMSIRRAFSLLKRSCAPFYFWCSFSSFLYQYAFMIPYLVSVWVHFHDTFMTFLWPLIIFSISGLFVRCTSLASRRQSHDWKDSNDMMGVDDLEVLGFFWSCSLGFPMMIFFFFFEN